MCRLLQVLSAYRDETGLFAFNDTFSDYFAQTHGNQTSGVSGMNRKRKKNGIFNPLYYAYKKRCDLCDCQRRA